MTLGRGTSAETAEALARDKELARKLWDLLEEARTAEDTLRSERAGALSLQRDRELSVELDRALTDTMRAAYAAERVAVGLRGYTDRIYRRRQLAKPRVRWRTQLAERLLTLREEHRLHGITRVPREVAA